MMTANKVPPYPAPVARGPRPGELTLAELAAMWGFGKTRTWELVAREHVIPCRRDRFRIYVREADAISYEHKVQRGRPTEDPT